MNKVKVKVTWAFSLDMATETELDYEYEEDGSNEDKDKEDDNNSLFEVFKYRLLSLIDETTLQEENISDADDILLLDNTGRSVRTHDDMTHLNR